MGAAVGPLSWNDLTDLETALVDAAMAGTWWAPSSGDSGGDEPAHGERWGPARTIRAQLLYQQLLTGRGNLCSDDNYGELPTPRVVRARGARATDRLDLAATALRHPLHLVACFRDCQELMTLCEATAPVVRLMGCRLPSGLDADQLRTTGDLDLDQVRVDGAVRLRGAHVGGVLDLTGGKFRNPNGDAIYADGVQVERDVFCREIKADGRLHLSDFCTVDLRQ